MRFCIWVLLMVVPALALAGEEAPAQPAPATDVKAAAQAFVKQLADGQFEAATAGFDDAMKKALPPDKLKEAWESIIASVGAFQEQAAVREEDQAAYRVVFVTCRFERSALEAKLVYDAEGKVAGLQFVTAQKIAYALPPYADSSKFTEKDVTVGEGEWALPGTLSLPNGMGPFPAVVLVAGSGPQDRDETIAVNKPFRDLAWGLASRGVAVLRYEKRTKVYQVKLLGADSRITVKEETVDDAAAAVALLRKTEGIDPRRVFVLGHSLGGMLVPRIAAEAPDAAGFVIMAGTTRPLEDVVLDQLAYLATLPGADMPPDAKAQLDAMRQQAQEAKDLKPEDANSSKKPLGAPAAYWLDLRGYHPAEAAKAITRPLLIIQGGRDYQVTKEDYEGWQKALAGRADVTFKLYPNLNHLFIAGEGKGTPSEYEKPGHVDVQVVDDLAAWVKGH